MLETFTCALARQVNTKRRLPPESQWHFGIDIGVGVNDLKMQVKVSCPR